MSTGSNIPEPPPPAAATAPEDKETPGPAPAVEPATEPSTEPSPRLGHVTLRGAILAAIGIVFLGWLLFLHGLAAFGLVGPDEPRYAEVAAEMASAHHYLTPRLLGTPWLEKPALYYWLAAATDRVRGVNDASARLPNALLALALALALGLFLWRAHSARAGGLALVVALTSAFMIAFGRAASTDMPLTATLSFSLICLYLWARPATLEPRDGRPPPAFGGSFWLAWAAVFLGLAVLAKGPVAVALEGLIWILFATRYRRWKWIVRPLTPAAIILFLIVVLPWYAAVSLENPAFVRVFFLQHNFERFATNRFQHPQPAWFFLPVLFLSLFPWSGWSLLPLRRALGFRRRIARAPSRGNEALLWFLGLWVLAPLIFFSASHSKLPGYILPAVPGLIAWVAVCWADDWARGGNRVPRWPGMISAFLTGLLPAALWILPWALAPEAERAPLADLIRSPWMWLAGVATVIVLLALLWQRRMGAYLAVTCALVAIAVAIVTGPQAGSIDRVASARPLARQIVVGCGPTVVVPLPITNPVAATAPFAGGSCSGLNLYDWQLNRELVYGMNFYLHRAPLDLEAAGRANSGAKWPSGALVALDRSNVASFVNLAASHGLQAREPLNAPLGAPWIVLRLGPR